MLVDQGLFFCIQGSCKPWCRLATVRSLPSGATQFCNEDRSTFLSYGLGLSSLSTIPTHLGAWRLLELSDRRICPLRLLLEVSLGFFHLRNFLFWVHEAHMAPIRPAMPPAAGSAIEPFRPLPRCRIAQRSSCRPRIRIDTPVYADLYQPPCFVPR
jgi:hypothetical protein